MAPAVLYEEEVDLQAEAVVETGLSPEVTVATTTANPVTAPAMPVVAQASPAMIEAWKNQRPALVEQVARAEQEYKNHTGTAEFDAYVASNACSAMMGRLRSEAFKGVERKLAILWGKLFVGSLPDMVMRAFRQYLRVEVFHPDLRNADQTDPLEGILIYSNGGKTTSDRRIVPQFQACDTRFELNKPLIFLYWKTGDIWSVIVPGKMTYLQLQTFYFDDKDQKRWETSEIISQVYLENMQRPSIVQDFAVLESAYSKLTARGALRNSYRKLERQLALLDRKIAAWSKVSLPEKQVNELLQRASMFEMRDPAAPRGLLLTGPPGTGKTLVARSVAESMQCHFQQLSIADLKQQQLGASGQRVREVWNQARNNQPAVIFLDECEGILGRRGAAETDVISTDIVQAFLAEWDGIAPNARVWVIGATNRRDMLDDAILSRFGWEMAIALPGAAERAAHLPAGDGGCLSGICDSRRDGFAHARDERPRPAASGQPGAHTCVPERSCTRTLSRRGQVQPQGAQHESRQRSVLGDAGAGRRRTGTAEAHLPLVRDAETWRAQGVTVPRSLLLTGPPGVGKTRDWPHARE